MLCYASQQRRYATAVGIVILGMIAPLLVAQEKPATAKSAASPVYDVVSIRPVRPDNSRTQTRVTEDGKTEMTTTVMISTRDLANGYSATNVFVLGLIMEAYSIRQVDRIKGLPEWTNTSMYNIEARMDDSRVQEFQKLPKEEQRAQRQAMLQALLADRFKLKAHFENTEMPLYEMVLDKGGLKAKPATPEGRKSPGVEGSGMIEDKSISIDGLASLLSLQAGQTVVNKTGISGRFDISLSWNPQGDSDSDDPRPSLSTAVKEQLGLRLVPAKGMVSFLMVDRVEKPSEN